MIHLHVHSNFSFLDGASPPDQLCKRAAELDMSALALTDHHGLYGIVRFIQAAKLYKIKPILGIEICLTPEPAVAGLDVAWGSPSHLVLLARDRTGYSNLCHIITKAQLDHQDNPQITLDDLITYKQGLIALSACRRGDITRQILAGRREQAIRQAQRHAEIFPDSYWIELEHHLLPDNNVLTEALLDVAARAGLPYVITNNVHYAYPDEYRLRDVMACIQTHTTLDEWSDLRHANGEYYLKSEAVLRAAFSLPSAIFDAGIEATREIAAACNVELLAVSSCPPDFDVPEGETAFSYLYGLCQEGARALYQPLTPAVSRQLAHELTIIEQMGLASFFLCVWDIVRFSHERGIRCAGRGSAADSIVAYVLGITSVDPIVNNLLFERFLNPGRVGMPDVDIDFDSRRRDEVIAYIEDRYTTAHAAMVANVITYRSRSAFRDVAKVMGFSSSLIDHLAGKLSYRGTNHMREELEQADGIESPASSHLSSPHAVPSLSTSTSSDVVQVSASTPANDEGIHLASPPEVRSPLSHVLDLCEQLDGYPRHLSLHNGGMLITAEPLIDVVPLEYATSGVRVCQFNKDDVEALGLIKFDILGLRTLSIVDEAVSWVRQGRGIDLPIDTIPLDDPAVYDFICSSKTIGIFQIESPGQWALLARSQPRTFPDLIVQNALFRPGPLQGGMVNPYIERRQGREEITYPDPSLENCLRDTLGIVLFQEQVLQVAHDFAGLEYADADGLRRAISHYRTEVEMDACRETFVEGAVRRGHDRALAERIYEMIAYFSGYGFCRSHAAAFAKIIYQTAFLKVYYPAEFLAAILSNEPCCYYPTQTVIEEARRWGIRMVPVDINRSLARYKPEHGSIRMGFMQVKGLTEESAQEMVEARARFPFASLADFWRRTLLDRNAVENLIAVGAFDSLGVNRRKLLWQLEEVIRTTARQPAAGRGSATMPARTSTGSGRPLGTSTNLRIPEAMGDSLVPELPPLTELDVAGLDFTLQEASARYSVMSFYRRSLNKAKILSIGQLQGRPPGTLARTAGIVISRQRPPTAKGMVFLVLADEEGELPVAIYPSTYRDYRLVINGSASLVIEGVIERQRYMSSMLARKVWKLNDIAHLDTKPALTWRYQEALPLL